MEFIDALSYYKRRISVTAILASVYFTRDVFEAKSDDKEDFKSS